MRLCFYCNQMFDPLHETPPDQEPEELYKWCFHDTMAVSSPSYEEYLEEESRRI